MRANRCYKATVNESETITAAQALGLVCSRVGAQAPVFAPIERS
jgi:hypothetical protein